MKFGKLAITIALTAAISLPAAASAAPDKRGLTREIENFSLRYQQLALDVVRDEIKTDETKGLTEEMLAEGEALLQRVDDGSIVPDGHKTSLAHAIEGLYLVLDNHGEL